MGDGKLFWLSASLCLKMAPMTCVTTFWAYR